MLPPNLEKEIFTFDNGQETVHSFSGAIINEEC